MGKALTFTLDGAGFSLEPVKVERKKIYGWTEKRTSTPDGETCSQAGLDSNGVTIIPKGAVKLGMLRGDGQWMEKSELQAVDEAGNAMEPVPSSFDGSIELTDRATEEELLDHVVSSVYQLSGNPADIRVSDDKAQIDGIMDAMIAENVKKGWVEYQG